MPRIIDFADLQLEIPDGPFHDWKRPAIDPTGSKKDNFGDVVKLRHEPTGAEVLIPARDFGAQAISHALTDLTYQVAASKR